jgi:hypothetical protein
VSELENRFLLKAEEVARKGAAAFIHGQCTKEMAQVLSGFSQALIFASGQVAAEREGQPDAGKWLVDEEDCFVIQGRNCIIRIAKRPHWCDRGNWLAYCDPKPNTHPRDFELDSADYWPRYYMDITRAKLECEAWLKKRKQWAPAGTTTKT